MKNVQSFLKSIRPLVGIFPAALLCLSACGSSHPQPEYHASKEGPSSDGYMRVTYTDRLGTTQTLGTPLMKEGKTYEETSVLQFPPAISSDLSVELQLPESTVAQKKTDYFPVLDCGFGRTNLSFRNEDLQNTGDQIIFTTQIVNWNNLMPNAPVSGEICFQLVDESGAGDDELVSVRFTKNAP
jgi:hypothetical protein